MTKSEALALRGHIVTLHPIPGAAFKSYQLVDSKAVTVELGELMTVGGQLGVTASNGRWYALDAVEVAP